MTQRWHKQAAEHLTAGDRIADTVARVMGSWKFIIIQSVILALWIIANVLAIAWRWDPYPFILLNLALSFQAAYAAPFIMISQNRQATRDRFQSDADYKTNVEAKAEIEALAKRLHKMDIEKLDAILAILNRA